MYDSLIERAKPRGLDKQENEGYYEKHHIIPRCLGGTDEARNLILLTGREHYIAHSLLWKMHPSNSKLFYAAWMMANCRKTTTNSRVYEAMKIVHAGLLSERSGFNSPNFKDLTGRKTERLTVIGFSHWGSREDGQPDTYKRSIWECLCSCGTTCFVGSSAITSKSPQKSCGCYKIDQAKAFIGELNPFFGRTHSDESKVKMAVKKLGRSPSNKGEPCSEEIKEKIRKTKAEKPTLWTDERREAFSKKMRGRPSKLAGKVCDPVVVEKRRLAAKESNLKRRPWHQTRVISRVHVLWCWVNCDVIFEYYLSGLTYSKVENMISKSQGHKVSLNKMFANFREGYNPKTDPIWSELVLEFPNLKVTTL